MNGDLGSFEGRFYFLFNETAQVVALRTEVIPGTSRWKSMKRMGPDLRVRSS